MRNALILSYLTLLAFNSISQNKIDSIISVKLCNCLNKFTNPNMDNYIGCSESAAPSESEVQLIIQPDEDINEEKGYEMAANSMKRISVTMVYSCPKYAMVMDSIRYLTLKNLNTDSLKRQIFLLNQTRLSSWNDDFYTKKGVNYFLLHDLTNTLLNFEQAIKLNNRAFQSLFFKAWALELKHNYEEAAALYKHVASLTGKGEFNIYAAIATLKKENKK